MGAFKAAQLFVPSKLTKMQPMSSSVDDLKRFSFFNESSVLQDLKSELHLYMADVSPDTDILR